jgi:hypothetical protein
MGGVVPEGRRKASRDKWGACPSAGVSVDEVYDNRQEYVKSVQDKLVRWNAELCEIKAKQARLSPDEYLTESARVDQLDSKIRDARGDRPGR